MEPKSYERPMSFVDIARDFQGLFKRKTGLGMVNGKRNDHLFSSFEMLENFWQVVSYRQENVRQNWKILSWSSSLSSADVNIICSITYKCYHKKLDISTVKASKEKKYKSEKVTFCFILCGILLVDCDWPACNCIVSHQMSTKKSQHSRFI